MDPNENTKNGPEQSPSQAAGAVPDVMQQESPRVCKICGGPNHHGCGCEAKQKQAAVQVETENIKTAEQTATEAPAKTDDTLEDILSPGAIRKAHEAQMKSYKDIETVAAGNEGLCACMYDITNYLKLITGDLITIRKYLTKEDEVKDATPENKD